MSLRILHDDNHVLAVVKPAGLPVVPDESGDESLLDIARAWVEEAYAKPGRAYLGVVHRLDRPVSGVVAFARTSKAAARMTRAFQRREVEKSYLAVGLGAIRGDEGVLTQWLWKDRERNRVHVRRAPAAEQRPDPNLKEAVTRWRVLRRDGERLLLDLKPETGRSHQLRVACASLGAPLAGDLKYGAREALPGRGIALHAARLALIHPVRRTPLALEAAVPDAGVWGFPADSERLG